VLCTCHITAIDDIHHATISPTVKTDSFASLQELV